MTVRPRSALLALLLLAPLSSLPRDARAQSAHMEAAVRAGQARAASRRGDTNEAVRLLRESARLEPTAAVERELALLLERQGTLREAAEAWTRCATLSARGQERDYAIARREFLRRTASLLRVRVSPGLAAREARVWFDRDVPRPVPVGGAESFVEGGSHRVRVESPGYLPFETMVVTGYGEPLELVARMVSASNADAAGAALGADGGAGATTPSAAPAR